MLGIDLVPEILLGEITDSSPPIWNEELLSAGGRTMTDPTFLAGMRILASLCAPCYVLDGVLFGKVACTMVRISCEQGPTPLTAVGLGLYCILLNGFRRLKSGWLVGQRAINILHRFPQSTRALTAKVYGCYYAHNWQYHRKLVDALPPLREAVTVGLEAGDLEWSGYDAFYTTDTEFFASLPLDVVARSQQESIDGLVKRKQLLQSIYLNIWRRLVLRLQLRAPESYPFHGKQTTDTDILHHLQEQQNHMFLFTFHLASTIHLFLERRFTEAVAQGEEAALHAGGVLGMMTNSIWSFWYSMALLYSIPLPMQSNVPTFPRPSPVPGAPDFFTAALLQQQSPAPQASPLSPSSNSPITPSTILSPLSPDDPFPYAVSSDFPPSSVDSILAKVIEQQAYLAQLAESCPANFPRLLLYLLEAERTRIHAHLLNEMQMVPYSVTMYDAAIGTARQHGLVYVEALANECCAYFFLSMKRRNEAKTYMRDAHFAYGRWGCTLKVNQISSSYQGLLRKGLAALHPTSAASESGSASSQSSGESAIASPHEAMSPNLSSFMPSSRPSGLLRQSSHSQSGEDAGSSTATVSRLSAHGSKRTISSHSPATIAASPGPVASSGIANIKALPPTDSTISLESLVLLRACAAFSVETNLSKLLRRVLQLLIQHANANKGYLALVHEDGQGNCEWRVEVQANIEDEDHSIRNNAAPAPLSSVQGTPMLPKLSWHHAVPGGEEAGLESPSPSHSSRESSSSTPGLRTNGISIEALTDGRPISECLPVTVFNLVVSTQSTLLLSGDDLLPTSSSPFSRDPYFATNHPKSLLCAPIKQQSKLVAVLYLENQFFAEAFSHAHVRVCEIVCIQAALSISNARLYSALEEQARGLEQTVAERTSELEEKNEVDDQRQQRYTLPSVCPPPICLCLTPLVLSRVSVQWLQAEISERQLAQEAMRKAKEDAETATKSKSDFLSKSPQHTQQQRGARNSQTP